MLARVTAAACADSYGTVGAAGAVLAKQSYSKGHRSTAVLDSSYAASVLLHWS